MKKYFKIGLATLAPVVFVAWVLQLFYNNFNRLMIPLLPAGWGYEWWYVFIFIICLVIAIIIIGFLFSFIKPIQWAKKKVEKEVIERIPGVNKIYSFGLEIADALIEDGKFDGEIPVVEVMYAGQKTLGLLTDAKNNIIFVATAPNPLNGFLFKADSYVLMGKMSVESYIKILTSLGKLGGDLWD